LAKHEHAKHAMPVSTLPGRVMQTAPAALYRAARRAHQIAHRKGTKVSVRIDGKLALIDPDPEMYEGLDDEK